MRKSNIWWHNNFFAHVLTGETVLKTPRGEYVLRPGDSAFAKKGSIITHNNIQENFCELLVFVPDNFIKSVAQKYKVPLSAEPVSDYADTVIRLTSDEVLLTYFQSLLTHFIQTTPPASALLKLKFEELLLNILSNNSQQQLHGYFSELCKTAKPSLREIMELNFFSNLTLHEFARLCARSLSAFKREFTQIYNATPGSGYWKNGSSTAIICWKQRIKVWMTFVWIVVLKTSHTLFVCLKINMVCLPAKLEWESLHFKRKNTSELYSKLLRLFSLHVPTLSRYF